MLFLFQPATPSFLNMSTFLEKPIYSMGFTNTNHSRAVPVNLTPDTN